MLAACVQPHVRLFYVLALTTAGRKTAILQLTWDRIDFERGLIHLAVVGEKNRKGRAVVPMTDRARAELLIAKKAAQSPYVIEYADEKVLDIKKGFAVAAVKRAKLPGTVPHDLRHASAKLNIECLPIFDRILKKLVGVLRESPNEGRSGIVRGSKEPDWTMEAINSPTGKIAEALFNDPRKNNLDRNQGFPPEWLAHAQALLGLGRYFGKSCVADTDKRADNAQLSGQPPVPAGRSL